MELKNRVVGRSGNAVHCAKEDIELMSDALLPVGPGLFGSRQSLSGQRHEAPSLEDSRERIWISPVPVGNCDSRINGLKRLFKAEEKLPMPGEKSRIAVGRITASGTSGS